MAIDQINGLSGFDPNRIEGQKVNRALSASEQGKSQSLTSTASGDQLQISEQARYLKVALSDEISSPNEARIAEIKAAISNGDYSKPEVIAETAARIADVIIG